MGWSEMIISNHWTPINLQKENFCMKSFLAEMVATDQRNSKNIYKEM